MKTTIRLLIAALILLLCTNVSGGPEIRTAAAIYGMYQASAHVIDAKRFSGVELDGPSQAQFIVKRTLKRAILYYELKFILKFVYYSARNNPEFIDEIKNLGKDVRKEFRPKSRGHSLPQRESN